VVHTPIYNRQHYRLQRHHIGTPLNHRLTSDYPCLYTDGSYKTTRQVFEQIEDIKIKCVSQLWLILGVTFSSVLILVVILSSVANAFFYLDFQYLLFQLVSKYVFYCFSGPSGTVSENLKVLPEYG
jgi:hypothetical protein